MRLAVNVLVQRGLGARCRKGLTIDLLHWADTRGIFKLLGSIKFSNTWAWGRIATEVW